MLSSFEPYGEELLFSSFLPENLGMAYMHANMLFSDLFMINFCMLAFVASDNSLRPGYYV
jgi:hypothetical protein